MLGYLNAGVERFRRVAWKDVHAALAKNFPGIDTGIDEMHGAACFGRTGFHRLTPGFEASECREQ
jgi:hypothetical protein